MMEHKNRTLGIFVIASMCVAMYSYFVPFVETSWYSNSYLTGVELIKQVWDGDSAGFLVVAVMGTSLGFIAALASLTCDSRFICPMILSAISGGSALVYFAESMDCVTNGFWMFVGSHAVSVVLSGIIWVNKQSAEKESGGTALDGPAKQAPVLTGTNRFCPECGTRIATGSKFCPNCGTSQHIPAEKTDRES